MADFTIKQGDVLPIITATLTDENGDAMDLTGVARVDFQYRRKGGSTVTTRTATVTDAANGGVEYAWVSADTATPGLMYAEWRVDYDGAGTYLTHPNTGFIDIEVVDTIATLEENELLLSVSELQDMYLFGVDLTDDDGNPFPKEMYEHYIRAGAAWLEKELDIPLQAQTITEELHDHYAQDYGRWGYFQLDKFPIISINEVKFQYPSTITPVVIDNSWIVLEDEGQSGVLQIVPGQGNIADVLLIPGQLMPLWSGAFGRVPGIWRISYTAGFAVGDLPDDLKHILGMWAAIGPLNIAGDLIAGAGIANFSISVPGLSQSIGTTSSATNSGYGARILEYQKEIRQMLPNLRRYYGKGTRLIVA